MQLSVSFRAGRIAGAAVGVALVAAMGVAVVQAQQALTLYITAVDASGAPVIDLKAEEVVAAEGGQPAKVTSFDKFSLPIKLTIAVDNGRDTSNALSHYRTGLTEMVKLLPEDLQIALYTMSPQPRNIVNFNGSREEVLRGITRFGPDEEPARFTDTLVEFGQRIEKEVRDKKTIDHTPVLLIISTTAPEASSYQIPEIEKAMKVIATNGARVSVAMTTTKTADATALDDLNNGRQALIAIPLVKATRGRYEALATSIRLQTLLPEMGKALADVHRKQTHQYKVVIERPAGATGALNNFDLRLTRQGLQGSVSGDGRIYQ